uniref:THAP domain-containing protein 1 n=1 Tax=Oryzias latipes TaxID=8090 RepID=A0A3B3HFQ2_ORYLA
STRSLFEQLYSAQNNKTTSARGNVSFHVFPKNVAVREKWIEFLGHGNVKKHTWVCSQHFTQDCFYNWQEKKMGFASKLILKPDAVPSIRTQLSRQAVSEPVSLFCCRGAKINHCLFC